MSALAFSPSDLLAMSQQDRRKFLKLINPKGVWTPLDGPQMDAFHCEADELFYGGAAGGGKTDLVCGLAHTTYYKSIIYRRQSTQLADIILRLKQLVGDNYYNGKDKIFTKPEKYGKRIIELGSVNNKGDEEKYQGRAHGLKVFDEITHFPKIMYQFLCGWTRTTNPMEPKVRIVCTGNPPTNADGQWVRDHWGPWLDPDHPNPAEPGELRWYSTINGKEKEFSNGDPYTYFNKKLGEEETVHPKSRTFIPAKVSDNPYLKGYEKTLQAMPEPLRSQMLYGDFKAAVDDNPWQVVPTAWVQAAMDRWQPRDVKGPMSSQGIDVACGGLDETVICNRHDNWYDKLKRYPGASTPSGNITAGLAISENRDRAPMHFDVIGWGKSAFDFADVAGVHAVPRNWAEGTKETTQVKKVSDGVLQFFNKRALDHWRMREALDPANDMGVQLPPDPKLKADLIAPKWELTPRGIKVEPKDDIIERLGRSPDSGESVILANINTPKKDIAQNLNEVPDSWSAYD